MSYPPLSKLLTTQEHPHTRRCLHLLKAGLLCLAPLLLSQPICHVPLSPWYHSNSFHYAVHLNYKRFLTGFSDSRTPLVPSSHFSHSNPSRMLKFCPSWAKTIPEVTLRWRPITSSWCLKAHLSWLLRCLQPLLSFHHILCHSSAERLFVPHICHPPSPLPHAVGSLFLGGSLLCPQPSPIHLAAASPSGLGWNISILGALPDFPPRPQSQWGFPLLNHPITPTQLYQSLGQIFIPAIP